MSVPQPPTPVPKPRAFLTAEWSYLAMLNYEIDPSVLRPFVPAGTELDTWGGKTFISVVGFMFLKTKVLGIPIPFHRNFEEVNLRFYVRFKGPEGWRRGVVFVREIVPRFWIAAVAKHVYNENYISLPMRHSIDLENGALRDGGSVSYEWRHNGRWNALRVTTVGPPQQNVAGSQEEFITEHYWGYAAQLDGGCVEYQVEHPPWTLWQVKDAHLDCDVKAVYGEMYHEGLCGKPSSAFLALGSPIIVRKGVRLACNLPSAVGSSTS